MVNLPPTKQEMYVFATEDDSDSVVVDIKGVYCILDGGPREQPFFRHFRAPSAIVLSSPSASTLSNAVALNREAADLVAVVGNIPQAGAVKEGTQHAELVKELRKVLSVPPIPGHISGSKPEAIILHKDVSHGTLTLYVLAGDAKDTDQIVKAYQSGDVSAIESACSSHGSVYLLVFHPTREDQPLKRILHFGSAPLSRIQQALERARSLPIVQSAVVTGESLRAKPVLAKATTAGAKPASAPSSRPAPPTRTAPAAAAAAKPGAPAPAKPAAAATPRTMRASLPAKPSVPKAPAASAPRPPRTSTMPAPTGAPSKSATRPAAAASRPVPAKEEVAKKAIVGRQEGAKPSRPSVALATTAAQKKPDASKRLSTIPPKAPAATQKTASNSGEKKTEPPKEAAAAASPKISNDILSSLPPMPVVTETEPHPSIVPPSSPGGVLIGDLLGVSTTGGGDLSSLPGGLPVPPSPTVTPATPQPPMTPDFDEAEQLQHDEKKDINPSEPAHNDIEEPIAPPVKVATPEPEPAPVAPVSPVVPEPVAVADPTPSSPHHIHDGHNGEDVPEHFKGPHSPQQPGQGGLLDDIEEPPRLMKISMDTEQLAVALGQDLPQNPATVEGAAEFDDLLTPPSHEEMQRKLSAQAEESLLSVTAAPFIAGLVSTVVESATIDGANQANLLEMLGHVNPPKVDSPTGEKLISFRNSVYENPDEPKEVKYEETDPVIDTVLDALAKESDCKNGEVNGEEGAREPNGNVHNGELAKVVEGGSNGWPSEHIMHLPPPRHNGAANSTKFHLSGPVHVELCSVPHQGSSLLLPDAASALEFFSNVRSSTYVLASGGEVGDYVLDAWMKSKGVWAANVPSRLLPTKANSSVSAWAHSHSDELAELSLSVDAVSCANNVITLSTSPISCNAVIVPL